MLGSGSSPLVVLLASVLKPLDDTRMRGKFAETLLERPQTQVHVAGRGTNDAQTLARDEHPRVRVHSLFTGSRLSPGRLAAQWRYWRLLLQLRPGLVIVHAPELLPLTLLWQMRGRGRHFLYDIQENYGLNIATQRVYRGLLRRALVAGLAWVETRAARRAAGLLLAEASYAEELTFLPEQPQGRVVVLENKYQPAAHEPCRTRPLALPEPSQPLRLLYSGTISVLNGVWEAIALVEQLHQAWPGGVRLTIIGYCQRPELLAALKETVAQHSAWLTLVGGAELVPHARIVAEISQSHLGLLPYQPHPSTARCRPTKLFEYLAHELPVLCSPNPLWEALLNRHGAGLAHDFTLPTNGPALLTRLRGSVFYPAGAPAEVLWASEGKKLWHLLDSLV